MGLQNSGCLKTDSNIVVKGLHDRVALDIVFQIAVTLDMSLEQFFSIRYSWK